MDTINEHFIIDNNQISHRYNVLIIDEMCLIFYTYSSVEDYSFKRSIVKRSMKNSVNKRFCCLFFQCNEKCASVRINC